MKHFADALKSVSWLVKILVHTAELVKKLNEQSNCRLWTAFVLVFIRNFQKTMCYVFFKAHWFWKVCNRLCFEFFLGAINSVIINIITKYSYFKRYYRAGDPKKCFDLVPKVFPHLITKLVSYERAVNIAIRIVLRHRNKTWLLRDVVFRLMETYSGTSTSPHKRGYRGTESVVCLCQSNPRILEGDCGFAVIRILCGFVCILEK